MASDQTQRRLRRRDAQRLFDELAADYLDVPDVSRAVMFAFVGGEGELIVKLPAAQCAALVAAGQAEPVRAGRSPMREWIGVPDVADRADGAEWRELMADAHRYVASLTASSTTRP